MNKKEIENLKILRRRYNYSQDPCNPFEYAVRQTELLEDVVAYLLGPLEDYEREKRNEVD